MPIGRSKKPAPVLPPIPFCPGCGYDLAGLTDQPCPECGMPDARRAEIFERLQREHTANLLGLRAVYELWRPVALLSVVVALISLSLYTTVLAFVCVPVFIVTRRLSILAQNPLDTYAEMNRFSTLRVRRRVWSGVSLVLLTGVTIGSLFFLAIRFVA